MTITISKKLLVLVAALVVVLCCVVGGTVAWLVDSTGEVVNTFTYGDVNIELAETTESPFTIVPGVNIPKDPKVTVWAGSEKCYVFVKIEEENWPEVKMADNTTLKVRYEIASAQNWLPLEGYSSIFYREVEGSPNNQEFPVLADNRIIVDSSLTKEEIATIKQGGETKLIFTAYAVQYAGFENNASGAWAAINASLTNS